MSCIAWSWHEHPAARLSLFGSSSTGTAVLLVIIDSSGGAFLLLRKDSANAASSPISSSLYFFVDSRFWQIRARSRTATPVAMRSGQDKMPNCTAITGEIHSPQSGRQQGVTLRPLPHILRFTFHTRATITPPLRNLSESTASSS